MTEITVTGAAETKLSADLVEISANVSLRGTSRSTVLEDANAAHARLVDRAKSLVSDGTASEYIAAPVSSSSNSWRNENDEMVIEHHAYVSVRILLTDLNLVGEIAAELTASGADIRVTWGLSPEVRDEQTRDLRGAAVQNARAAAEDYAEALSASSLLMVSLRDIAQGVPIAPRGARMAMAVESAPEVTAGEITVSVQIEATFTAL
ncbi:SIMPL domain-containing protein [Leucobacter denitrificans]|uniref:SIMPL domain-containing protein n=1 Tax=Leucobacter denitrificans TaxID=683042 RepID=A0A7G9S5B1_9MICO|nr:SIMPL domain-containing protein [Leucobacter denitrificans]QNN63036.1 SIMPL domain-containing protein [Leucobacter denitrificans]